MHINSFLKGKRRLTTRRRRKSNVRLQLYPFKTLLKLYEALDDSDIQILKTYVRLSRPKPLYCRELTGL